MTTRLKGTISVIISAIVFGGMPLMAKVYYREGGNAVNLSLYRFLLILPFLYILIKKEKDLSLKITKEEFKKILLMSGIGFSPTALLLYMSYNYIPSGMATTIHFMYPVFVILGCVLFYKEKISPIKIMAVILCTLGILMFYDGEGQINILGIALAFASAVVYSFYTVYLDKSGMKEMNVFKLTFYIYLISAAILFIFSIITKSLTLNITPLGWIMALILSVLVGIGGACLFQLGVRIIGAQNTAILSTFEPITSIIIGVLFLDESFGIKTLFGIIFILVAVILISVFEK